MSLVDFFTIMQRRKWLVLGAIAVSLAVTIAVSYSRPSRYRASATLTFQKQSDLSSALLGTTYVTPVDIQRELATSATLISGREMGAKVADAMGLDSSGDINGSVTAAPLADTNAIVVTSVSRDPAAAAEVANVYAQTFAESKKSERITQLTTAERYIQAKLAQYNTPAQRSDPMRGTLRYQLQTVRLTQAMAQGNYTVAETAVVPASPFSPNHTRDLLIGLVIGLIAGAALALISDQLDVRVRKQEELSDALQLPILGRIPRLRGPALAPTTVAVMAEPDGMVAEAYRMLRGNLDFVSIDTTISSMLVTSCTQSEGKTSTACNLGVTLARSGRKTVIVELDLRRPKVHQYFGLENISGISNVVAGRLSLDEALQSVPIEVSELSIEGNGSNPHREPDLSTDLLRVLTSGPLPPNPGEIVTSRRIGEIITELAGMSDVVLIDSPPFLAVGDAAALAAQVDGVLVVMKMKHVTRPMLRETADFLAPLPCKKLGIVVTNADLEGGNPYMYRRYRRYPSATAAPIEDVAVASEP